MAKGTKFKTPLGDLQFCFIKGEGRNQAMPGQPDHFQFVASVVFKKDSEQHKAVQSIIDAEWKRYKEETGGVKGKPDTTGIKPVMVETGEVDEDGDPIREEGDEVRVTFKTNVKWPDGKDRVVKVFDHKGNDITVAYANADWYIGPESTGVIHGSAVGNDGGGKHKVSLYLSAVQIGKLVKGEGDEIDTEEIDGEDIDLGEDVAAIGSGDSEPDL